jgi:transposase
MEDMRGLPPLAAVLFALLASGCAGRVSAPEPLPVAASAAGVDVGAAANAWRGWPAELGRAATPVRVTIANHGAVPVRVDATRFALALPEGGRLAAVLPADIHGVAVEPAPAALSQVGLALGETREQSGPGWALNDPAPDRRVDPTLEPERTWALPSADMLSLALPEGPLAPGRTVSGFVYFERAPPGVRDVTLTWQIVEAGGEPLGVVRIPLTLR